LNYIVYGLILFLIFFIIINYLRKLHWDTIHHNLLDLEDDIGGNIIRKGFLARPVFVGKYHNCEVTINFSQEKQKKGRTNFINISLNKNVKKSITLLSLEWLKSQNEKTDDLQIISLENSVQYGIRSKQVIKGETKQNVITEHIEILHPFNYLFIGETGIIFEKSSLNIAKDTELENLKIILESIFKLSDVKA